MAIKYFSSADLHHEIQTALHNERWKEAEELINQALGVDPDNPFTMFFLGNLFSNTERYGIAIPILREVCRLKPDFYEGWANLGGAYRREHKVAQARECLIKATELNDTDSNVFANLAACYVNEGDPENGEQYARRGLELNPENYLASWNLALILLEQAKWDEGFERYAQNEETKQRLYRTYTANSKTPVLYELDALGEDQVVVVHGEQGLGDEVMFLSILPDFIEYRRMQAIDRGVPEDKALYDTRIIIESHSRLAPLVRRSFPMLEVNGTRDQEYLAWAVDRKVDWSCPIGNLGKWFRKNEKSFMDHTGYIEPNMELTELYRHQLELMAEGKPIIGVAWSGGVKVTQTSYRTIPLSKMVPILEQDALFVSMQYKDDEKEVDDLELFAGIKMARFPEAAAANDVDKVCALTQACDLIITVNNSLHHFSGALGKECWTMTPKGCAWRYAPMNWARAIWYPYTSKIFRQGEDRDWDPVIDAVAHELKHWLKRRNEK